VEKPAVHDHFLRTARCRIGEATKLLEILVNLDTCSRETVALDRASRWIEDQLRALDFDVERAVSDSLGPTLIGRKSGRGKHRILLLGHYDTVFEPGEPARRPFKIKGGRGYGPGVADMKGGVITLWEAVRCLKDVGWDNAKSITVIHNGDEEITSLASRQWIEAAARVSDICLVFEPGRPDGSIVVGRKGVGRFILTVRGRTAHAGVSPQDGASAVVSLAHKILALDSLNDLSRGVTVNTVVLRGGTRSNIIPDEAVAEIDVRIPTMAMADVVLSALEGIASEEHVQGTRAALSGGIHRPPFEPAPKGPALVALAREAASALGVCFNTTTTGGGSDGNFVSALGVPVLDGMGAIGAGYHTPEEFIELSTLPERAALAALVIYSACQRDEFLRNS